MLAKLILPHHLILVVLVMTGYFLRLRFRLQMNQVMLQDYGDLLLSQDDDQTEIVLKTESRVNEMMMTLLCCLMPLFQICLLFGY